MWNRKEENESSLKNNRIVKSFLIVVKYDYAVNIEKIQIILQFSIHTMKINITNLSFTKNVVEILFQYL